MQSNGEEMSYSFSIRLADLNVGINCKYNYTEVFCKDYKTDCDKFDITAQVTDDEIAKERSLISGTTPAYAENICVYRNIAEQLPEYSRAVFHGAAITYKDMGVIFTAPSGTGKTTHIKLWHKYLKDNVKVINGDKPIIRIQDGTLTAFGTPWSGKEFFQNNISAKVFGICVLAQGKENKIKELSKQEAAAYLMHQIYLPKNASALSDTLSMLDQIINSVPCYFAEIDMTEQAVKTTFEALLKTEYKGI